MNSAASAEFKCHTFPIIYRIKNELNYSIEIRLDTGTSDLFFLIFIFEYLIHNSSSCSAPADVNSNLVKHLKLSSSYENRIIKLT